MTTGRVVIVGAGHAGTAAAMALRARGFSGEILFFSDEARMPYERPPLSKGWITGQASLELLAAEGQLEKASIDFHPGRTVTILDPEERTITLDDGEKQDFDSLILATGSKARRLDLPGSDAANIRTLRSADDAERLRADLSRGGPLVVIGGGYIGLEVAATIRSLGNEVTVIEAADRVMKRTVSPLVSSYFENRHRAAGVRLVLGQSVEALVISGAGVTGVTSTSGEDLSCSTLLVGIGGLPNTDLAASAGIKVDNGILVDAECRTTAAGIYAIGDAARTQGGIRLESVQNAQDQADIVAAAITGTTQQAGIAWFWSDQYGDKLQIAGLLEPDCEQIVRRNDNSLTVFHHTERGLVCVEAVNDSKSFLAGRKALEGGLEPDLDALADPSIPIKKAFVRTKVSTPAHKQAS